jgi:hypothetical protein
VIRTALACVGALAVAFAAFVTAVGWLSYRDLDEPEPPPMFV